MLNEYAVSCLYCCFKVALQLTVVVVVGGGVDTDTDTDTDTAAAAAAVVVWFFILSGVSLSVLPTLLMIDVKPLCFFKLNFNVVRGTEK